MRYASLASPSVGTWSYGYDPLGRRRVNAGPSLTGTGYLYDGWNVARESTVAGTTTANLLNGPGLDERYIRGEISGSTTTSVAYLTDALGSTVALEKNGAAQTFYGYDPFGVQATPTGVADGNPYAFTGAQLDVTGLQYQMYRYYSPALGIFISEDPLGLAGRVNRYAYASDGPSFERDPTGDCPWCIVAGATIGAGLNLATQLVNNQGSLSDVNWGQGAIAGGAGALGGGLGAATSNLLATIAGSAAINAGQTALNNLLCNKNISDGVLNSAVTGGLLGGFGTIAGGYAQSELGSIKQQAFLDSPLEQRVMSVSNAISTPSTGASLGTTAGVVISNFFSNPNQ